MIKKLFAFIAALAVCFSCYDDSKIWDTLNDHESRIYELEQLCKQMNTNISSLQKIVESLQKNEYVTNVVAVVEGGVEVGYIFTFSGGNKVTVYHGRDGKDGADGKDGVDGVNGKDGVDGVNGKDGVDGKDGYTPKVGVKLNEEGVYCWTLDGEWLLDENGNMIPTNGSDGIDGITPELKIEEGYWYVSYDNGANWMQLGQATGDRGPQGYPGVGGDSMFTDIDLSNNDYVVLYLNNGMQIQLPTWYAFEALRQQCEQMNINIQALQTVVSALENNDYVTGVTPLYENAEEIGYRIDFSKSGSITIYHGKDGQDGVDGVDGHTPVIGVVLENDVYYWTVDGSWLLDDQGNKVPAVGKDGTPGEDGTDGTNSGMPELKIEDGKWYVSYDKGISWIELGQATGDQGKPGVGGDSMFSNVDYSHSEYVLFILGNGMEIKVPTWYAFETLRQQCEQINVNIQALQTVVSALENNDYVTGVTPLYENAEEIGYRIDFSKSGSITIYHGKKGADGYVPQLSVSSIDGCYYWMIDDNWMVDANGNMVPASGPIGITPQFMIQDGYWYVSYDNGMNWYFVGQATGEQGPQGDSGNTPQFMIQDGYWYVSYDYGMNWNFVGQATGDQGPQGDTGNTPQFMIQDGYWYVSYDNCINWYFVGQATGSQGNDGDSMFSFIDYYSSSDYVTFYLTNGSYIQLPTLSAFQNLQVQCNQNNANISALQSIIEALQNKDYIECINPLYDGNWCQIGYEICFSQSGWISIYNGSQGHTPVIGVGTDADGRYYWTIDGGWLYDDQGNLVPTTGQDGQIGITPQLKIDNGYWYVSYDNSVTWKKLGKATGADGENGDAFFKSVTQNDMYVSIVLADGTEIKIPRYEEPAATIALKKISGNAAIFEGTVNKTSPDLKVTVYYSTYNNLTVYKHVGSVSLTEFPSKDFTLRVNGLVENTQYYFFTEIIRNGTKTYSEIDSFVTGSSDAYIDWENGENVEDEI